MRQIFPSHDEQLQRLSKIEGQIKGIRKMIEERRYCIDILSQFKAVHGALRQIEMGVLEKHAHHCVQEALHSKDEETIGAKVEEMIQVLSRME
jgi:DNA-binding FrmR family transcriptional regulator